MCQQKEGMANGTTKGYLGEERKKLVLSIKRCGYQEGKISAQSGFSSSFLQLRSFAAGTRPQKLNLLAG